MNSTIVIVGAVVVLAVIIMMKVISKIFKFIFLIALFGFLAIWLLFKLNIINF